MAGSGVIDVVAAVLWRGKRFLAVDRPPGKVMAGWWVFPGGKIDPGESRADALTRELHEELAVTPVEYAPWTEKTHVYDHATVRLYFFHVTRFTGEPRGLEGQRLKWVTPTEAETLAFLPADREILALLARL